MEINMQIKKVAVFGAGAVGTYVIWGLSQAENLSLGVIAEGERAGRIGQHCAGGGRTHNRNEFNERCRQRRNYCAESESR